MDDAEILPFEPRKTPEKEPSLPMSRSRFADLLSKGLITVSLNDETADDLVFSDEPPDMLIDSDAY